MYNPNPQVNSAVGPGHELHAVYAQEWDHIQGKQKWHKINNLMVLLTGKVCCLNSWGKKNSKPMLSPGENKLTTVELKSG